MSHTELEIKEYGDEILPNGKQNLAMGFEGGFRVTSSTEVWDFVGNFRDSEEAMSFIEDVEEEASRRGWDMPWLTEGPPIDENATLEKKEVVRRGTGFLSLFQNEPRTAVWQWRKVK